MTMETGDVKLIGTWLSPFVARVKIALNLKSIKYEFLEEKDGEKSELLLKSNPVHKKIPVLLHDDRPICESLIIMEYIDQVWTNGASILPSDPYSRAISRFWAAYIDEKLQPLLKEMRSPRGDDQKTAIVGQLIESLMVLEETFVKLSEGKSFFGGQSVGYLDIAVGCYVGIIKLWENITSEKLLDETKMPELVNWAERFCSEDSVKDVIPGTNTIIEIAEKFKNIRASASSFN